MHSEFVDTKISRITETMRTNVTWKFSDFMMYNFDMDSEIFGFNKIFVTNVTNMFSNSLQQKI